MAFALLPLYPGKIRLTMSYTIASSYGRSRCQDRAKRNSKRRRRQTGTALFRVIRKHPGKAVGAAERQQKCLLAANVSVSDNMRSAPPCPEIGTAT